MLKEAACKLFGVLEQKYKLTDEYFNNLQACHCTIQDFYLEKYSPLNENHTAVVYL
jgi:hypothetical protein